MATSINNTIECNQPHANLDSYYGPYESVNEALQALNSTTINGVDYTKRHIGLTVGIMVSEPGGNGIIEYWFKNGTSDNDLVLKTSGSSLPGGVKIVTFDKNGGSGVQNSILTDKYSQVKLPECTLTKTNDDFKKWQYNDVQYNAGDIVTIGSFTEVLAIWNSSPAPTQKYSVSWRDSEGLTITGTNEQGTMVIENGQEYDAGTRIKLTATLEPGYVFDGWNNKPSGATESGNVLIFTLNSSVRGITAIAHQQIITQYKVTFTPGIGIKSISGNIPETGENVETGHYYEEGVTIILTAALAEGYDSVDWIYEGECTRDGNKLTFVLTSDVEISAKGIKVIPGEVTTNWCACAQNGQGLPVFSNIEEEFHVGEGSEYTIELTGENDYKALYVITPDGYSPSCMFERETPMTPINEYRTDGVYDYYLEKEWVESESNATKGDLKTKGDLMFVYIDKNETPVLKDNVTIKIKRS